MNFELKINTPSDVPVISNFSELKEQLESTLADYSNRVYTDATISEAKADRAKLNKLKKALNDERIAREKAYLEPFMNFKVQVKELTNMIEVVSEEIGGQIAIAEEARIEAKYNDIKILFDEIKSNYDCDFITLDSIFNSSWDNKSVSMNEIAKEITNIFEQAIKDLATIKMLPNSYQIEMAYKDGFNLNDAIEEGNRIVEIQNRQTKSVADTVATEEKYQVAFKCEVTRSQALALKSYCDSIGIKLIKV